MANTPGGWTRCDEVHASDREWNKALGIPMRTCGGGTDVTTLQQLAAAPEAMANRLQAHGFSAPAAKEKAAMFAKAAVRLMGEGVGGKQRAKAFWVPGQRHTLQLADMCDTAGQWNAWID